MKVSVLLLLGVFVSQLAIAQEKCATGDKMLPQTQEARHMLQQIREKASAGNFGRVGDTLIIPTVVHIIHLNGFGDITDEQVHDGIRVINEDFIRLNADTTDTRDIFKAHAGQLLIQFRLAKLDSVGDSTTAIVRVDTNLVPHPDPPDPDFDNVKFLTHWPEDTYYNIWLVRAIQGGALGYAQYPGTDFTYGGPWNTWGVIIKSNVFGTIGTSSADGRTATHEIGHSLGLYHTFLSFSAGCAAECDSTGDEVCDTPPATPTSTCDTSSNTCSNDTLGPSAYTNDVIDQLENYMSYNSCQNMFSQGQTMRMQGFIDAFPLIKNLGTDANLVATGLLQWPIGVASQSDIPFSMEIWPNIIDRQGARIKLEIGREQKNVKLWITDLLGRNVRYLENRSRLGKGIHYFDLDTQSLPAGSYLVVFKGDEVLIRERILKL